MLSHEIGRNQIQHFFFAKQSGLCWNTLRRIQVALNKLQLDEETIGIEATYIYGESWFTLSGRMAPLALQATYPCLQYKAGLQIQGCLSGSA